MIQRAALRLFACVVLVAIGNLHAAEGDMTRQEPSPLVLLLGNAKGDHRFTPDSLSFETGKICVLRLEHPGPNACYFGSQGLADSVYWRKVVALGPDGKALA